MPEGESGSLSDWTPTGRHTILFFNEIKKDEAHVAVSENPEGSVEVGFLRMTDATNMKIEKIILPNEEYIRPITHKRLGKMDLIFLLK